MASPGTALAQIAPQIPASIAPARGYLFVIFEQLPDVGTEKIIRKVAAIPKDFSLQPNAIRGTLTLAEHVLNLNPLASQYVSASDRSHGAPSIEGKPLLIDVKKAHLAGAHVYSVQEVVADLRRLAAEQPGTRPRVEKLVWAIENIEGEVLIKGAVERHAITTVSSAHQPYISSAEDLWRAFQEKTITKPQLESGLDALRGSYEKARIVGRVGRVLTVVGVILTVKDIADAADRCVTERSLKPLSAEAVRQVGGWGGAAVGGKIGFGLGAVFGIETGPGAIVTGALGAIVFGALGYFGSDLIADQISPH
jgi:hypothetical protein